jgi:DNA-binding response OmpR family regulator
LPCIPAGKSAKEERGAGSARVAGQSPAGTVLVIEDEPTLRTGVSKFLRMRGFSVIEAEDGNVGTELFLKNAARVDVVLLDMTLPGRSGREVLVELQRLEPGVKVIVTSAYGRSHVQNSLEGLRPWGYIQKPYQLADVERLLRNIQADEIGHATA